MTKAAITKWAEANYDTSFFAQTIIECWDDSDFENVPNKKFLLSLEDAVNDRCNAARNEIF